MPGRSYALQGRSPRYAELCRECYTKGALNKTLLFIKNGARRDRTADNLGVIELLYQLSYNPG